MRMVKALVWLTIATALAMAGGCDTFEQPPRKALPSTATDIHESDWNNYFPPDYCYLLKAQIRPQEFETYRIKLKFVPIPETMKEELYWPGWDNFGGQWWNPSANEQETFHDPTMSGSQHAFMKYENGYVYYLEYAGF